MTLDSANSQLKSDTAKTFAYATYLGENNVVVLTKDKTTGTVTDITSYVGGNLTKVGADSVGAGKKFKGGASAINGTLVSADCTVVTRTGTSTLSSGAATTAGYTFSKVETAPYSSYADEIALGSARAVGDDSDADDDIAVAADFKVIKKSGKVAYILINKDTNHIIANAKASGNSKAWGSSAEEGEKVTGVVKSFKEGTGTGAGATPDEITILTPSGEVTYSNWYVGATKDAGYNTPGALVTITLAKADSTQVYAATVTAADKSGAVTNYGPTGATFDDTDYNKGDTCIVYDASAGADKIKLATWGDLNSAGREAKVFKPENVSDNVAAIVIITA